MFSMSLAFILKAMFKCLVKSCLNGAVGVDSQVWRHPGVVLGFMAYTLPLRISLAWEYLPSQS